MKVNATIKIDLYGLIDDAVENGVRYGYNRARKHDPNPGEDHVIDVIRESVLDKLNDLINFNEPEN